MSAASSVNSLAKGELLLRALATTTLIMKLTILSLYCSSECRLQDKGTSSPALVPKNGVTTRLTTQIPVSLSPLLRPTHHQIMGPSPRMPPSNVDSSSASSVSSSPIQSPKTNPSGSDSPRKDAFNLPPPAYPSHQAQIPSYLGYAGSVPVKIPALVPRAVLNAPHIPSSSHTPASNGSTVYPIGVSIDTLRFGRKPGLTNSVTSPKALLPRCACGKPANHKGRPSSKDRAGLEPGFSALNLGPSVISGSHCGPTNRVASDSATMTRGQLQGDGNTGQIAPVPAHAIGDVFGCSLLSRSRSDPIPPSPNGKRNSVIAPMAMRESTSRRASHNALEQRPTTSSNLGPGGGAPTSISRGVSLISPAPMPLSPRRGRSRERQSHPLDDDVAGLLNHPPEREHPPSRSQPRRNERRRSDEDREKLRAATGAPPTSPTIVDPPQIMPSWSRQNLTSDFQKVPGEGVAPMRRPGSEGQRSPGSGGEDEDDRKREEMKRASKELGQVFGVAAG